MNETILVTGGAGFIGSNFIYHWLQKVGSDIVNLDKLTYAGNAGNLRSLESDSRYAFVKGDICDAALVRSILDKYKPTSIVHLAAETHVDRSICAAAEFVRTNLYGTFMLLEEAMNYWGGLDDSEKALFRFLHVSTDEVYGSLGPQEPAFTETTPYRPNSPYAASKAGSDHLARSYYHTYGLPVIITNCSNNYGPFQFPEKLIPLTILNALSGQHLPVYGDGQNVRDWLYVEDHCDALRRTLECGKPGQTYNIGGSSERKNIDVVKTICNLIDELRPNTVLGSCWKQVKYVKDRPGHDRRYAIDSSKIMQELGWQPKEPFEMGMRKTVKWYLSNMNWVAEIRSSAYYEWIQQNYGGR